MNDNVSCRGRVTICADRFVLIDEAWETLNALASESTAQAYYVIIVLYKCIFDQLYNE